jgi:putative FmdB family regulatory protein
MPIYEYICFDCGKKFEAIRPIKDADKTIECVKCQSEHTGRQLAVFFASSGGKVLAGGGGGCGSCGGGSCASCGH